MSFAESYLRLPQRLLPNSSPSAVLVAPLKPCDDLSCPTASTSLATSCRQSRPHLNSTLKAASTCMHMCIHTQHLGNCESHSTRAHIHTMQACAEHDMAHSAAWQTSGLL